MRLKGGSDGFSEKRLTTQAQETQWTLLKSGWPDFALLKEGQVKLIECKNLDETIKPSQLAMFAFIERHLHFKVEIAIEGDLSNLLYWRDYHNPETRERATRSSRRQRAEALASIRKEVKRLVKTTAK